MTSDQPRPAPHNRSTATPTPLNAVFRRLSDTPAAVDAKPEGSVDEPLPLERLRTAAVARTGAESVPSPRNTPAPQAAAVPAQMGATNETPPPPTAPDREVAIAALRPDDTRPAESLAEILRRSVAEGALARQVQGAATVLVHPLSHSPSEIGPLAQQSRTEGPLGASREAVRFDDASRIDGLEPAREPASSHAIARYVGLPAGNLPAVLVEPRTDRERASQGPGDRPTLGNRRLYRRVGIEAELEIDGVRSPLVDLSMGGFAAASAPPVEPNAVVPVSVRVSVDGVELGTRLRARMVYCDAPRTSERFSDEARSGGRFIDLTASQTTFLRYVVTRHSRSLAAPGATTLLAALPGWSDPGPRIEAPPLQGPVRDLPGEPQGETARRGPRWSRWLGRVWGSRREGPG